MPTKLPLLAALLLLAGLLLAASVGQAAPPSPAPTAFYFEEEFEPEEGEFEEEELGEEECALAQEEAAEGIATPAEAAEICAEIAAEAKGEAPYAASPPECPLRSASAHATTRHNRLKLTIGYTTSEPTKARIEIRKGKRKIGSAKRHLNRSGVLRFTKRLGRKLAGKRTVVRIEPAQGSAGCPSRRLVLHPR